jgi:hypothetical protein
MEPGQLLSEVEAFAARVGMTPATFGLKAMNDGKFVKRLRAGGRCWPETAERALRFMRDYKQPGGPVVSKPEAQG